jgi:ubiquinone/menaquinone biosynthesis C-methylase UbiE
MNNSSHVWDNLFSSGEFIWKEPHELVIRLIPDLEKLSGNRVLDLGCGAGRHLVFLSERDYVSHGTDIAFAGLVSARRWLLEEGFKDHLSQSEMDRLPYASCSFDAVVCLYVIYHGTIDKIERAFREIYRVLRLGGLALVTFISDRHHRYGYGEKIETNTFITNMGADAGVPHHFCGEDEMLQTINDFEILEFELLEKTNDEDLLESHWAMLIKKVSSNDVV